MKETEARHDVIIIGGGPGGSTCATMLSRAGHDVLLFEREKFPRFHIGESLTAFAADAFKKLGVYEELKKVNYVKKKGLHFVLPDKEKKVYFPEYLKNEPDEIPWAFQMRRAVLDEILLRNAEKSGATIKERHAVREVIFEGDRAVGVVFRDLSEGAEAEDRRAYAKWVIDSTGQAGLINRHLKNNCYDDFLLDDKISIFSHWEGPLNITNSDDELNFKLCVHENRRDWAWYIPVDKYVVSIGVVIDRASVKHRDKSLEELFYEYTAKIPFVGDLVRNPAFERIEKFRGVKDFSYRSKRYYGPGWALTGDAAGFLDPIFSTGLQITFNSAFALSEAIDKALRNDAPDEVLFENYRKVLDTFFRINATLVYRFYECGIDFDKMQSGWYMWRHTPWADFRQRLRFLYYGTQIIVHPRKKVLAWAREVLFGNVRKGNQVARLFLLLAENYEKLHEERMRAAMPRLEFNELET